MFRLACLLVSATALSTLTVLTACSPTDQNVFSYKERLNSGKPLLYNREGEINKGCGDHPWSDVRLTTQQIEDLSFIGTYPATDYGDNNCFEVGSIVSIKNKDTDEVLHVQARIRSVAIWNTKGERAHSYEYKDIIKWSVPDFQGPEKLKEQLEGYINNLFNTEVMSVAEKSYDGVINVTHLDLIRNGQDNRELAEKGRKRFENSLSYYDETNASQPLLKNCGGENWSGSGFRVDERQWSLLQALNANNSNGDARTLWYVWGGKSACLAQGSTAQIVSQKTREELGSFEVVKVRELTQNLVNANLKSQPLKLSPNMSQEEALNDIQEQFEKKSDRVDARLYIIEFKNFQISNGGRN